MSNKRRNPARDKNEKEIIKRLRQLGISVSRIDGTGIPDIVIGVQGVNIFAEIKTETGKMTPAQVKWHNEWQGQKATAKSFEEVIQVINDVMENLSIDYRINL